MIQKRSTPVNWSHIYRFNVIDLLLIIDEESNHDISSLLSSVGRSLAMLASANQRSQESVADLALEINRILSKHNFDVHKRCAQDVLDIKQVLSEVLFT